MPIPNSKLKSNPRPNSSFDIMMNRASLNVLIRHLKYNNINVKSLNDLEQIILSKNAYYTEWLDDTIEALTHLIWSSTILLDISTVVIASAVDGGLPNVIKERLDYSLEASAPESCVVPKIKTGKFGSDAGTIGAASLPIFYSFSPSTEILM